MSNHFIEKCRHCGVVTGQCRCPGPDKEQRWTTCGKCAWKGHVEPDPLQVPDAVVEEFKQQTLFKKCEKCGRVTASNVEPKDCWFCKNDEELEALRVRVEELGKLLINKTTHGETILEMSVIIEQLGESLIAAKARVENLENELDIAKGFHDVAVAERNCERYRVGKLEREQHLAHLDIKAALESRDEAQARVDELEAQVMLACEEPPSDCECSGCSAVREINEQDDRAAREG